MTLQLWDTAGQERYLSLGSAFYRGGDACILVYDITNHASFDHLNTWRQNFLDKGAPKNPESFPFFVFGNKRDREQDRKVSVHAGKDWANKHGIPQEETSALDSVCIEKAFDRIAN